MEREEAPDAAHDVADEPLLLRELREGSVYVRLFGCSHGSVPRRQSSAALRRELHARP